MSDFTNRIDKILTEKNLSRRDLAAAIGVSASVVQSWVQRGSSPAADTVYKVAMFLGVSMEYLVTGIEYELTLPTKEAIPGHVYTHELTDEELKDLYKWRREHLTPAQRGIKDIYDNLPESSQKTILKLAAELERLSDKDYINFSCDNEEE